jgi:hypothetical protein
METNRRRKIRSGKEFDHLFPPPTGEDKTIKAKASVDDTMALIQRSMPAVRWHTEKIADILKGRTREETCSNIWHFVYHHIQYKRDKEGVEQIRSPRRTWSERQTGVDCDCYTEFISSILLNLGIPHRARITKYPKKYPEEPRWQHVYPIVLKAGREHSSLEDRDDYIVLDCVKEDFDDEQPYLECKDYSMRLDYLDGIEQETIIDENIDYVEHDNVDLADIASLHDDDEEVGSLLKKVVKKATTTVASNVKTVANNAASNVKAASTKVASNVKAATKTVAAQVKTTAQKVGDKVGDGIRVINRYVNPATILLRNGFLLAMKINLMNVAGRLRYAYLTDAQAQAKGINVNELNKVRSIKDRAETVYWQAGGKKENLKKAILQGKGNRDKKVPLSGLGGLDGSDNVYADRDEYNIIHSDNVEGLGEIASATAITAATAAVAAIAGALKQVTGLFAQGGGEEQAFQSETDNAGTAATAPSSIPDDEDAFTYEDTSYSEPEAAPFTLPAPIAAPIQNAVSKLVSNFIAPVSTQPQSGQVNTATLSTDTSSNTYEDPTDSSSASTAESALPDQLTPTGSRSLATQSTATNVATKNQSALSPKEGVLKKTTTWIKQNPGKSLLVAGGIVAGGILVVKALSSNTKSTNGLSGLPKSKSKDKKKVQRRKKHGQKHNKVKKQILL